MRGLTAAWLAGLGIVVWRQVHAAPGKPPVPAQLAAVTILFGGLALIGDAVPSSQRVISLVAWGLDIAGVLNLFAMPGDPFGAQIQQAAAASAGGTSTSSSGGAISGSAGTIGPLPALD